MAEERYRAYQGLPTPLKKGYQIGEILLRGGMFLPFPAAALRTLAVLLDSVPSKHWESPGGPTFFRSNQWLADQVGVDIRTVKKHLTWLQDGGAIFVLLGPGGRRVPVRNEDGTVRRDYGIKLAPAAAVAIDVMKQQAGLKAFRKRQADIAAQVEDARRETRACYDALLRCAAVDSGDTLSTALDAVSTILEDLETLSAGMDRLSPEDDLSEIERQTTRLRVGAADIASPIVARLDPMEISFSRGTLETPEGDSYATQYNTTDSISPNGESNEPSPAQDLRNTKSPSKAGDGKLALEESVAGSRIGATGNEPAGKQGLEGWQNSGRDNPPEKGRTEDMSFTPGLAGFLDVTFADKAREITGKSVDTMGDADFRATIDAIRQQIGLSDTAWSDALARHRFDTVAAFVVLAKIKPVTEFRVSRLAWLAGTLKKEPCNVRIRPSVMDFRERRQKTLYESGEQPVLGARYCDPELVRKATAWVETLSEIQKIARHAAFHEERDGNGRPEPRESVGWQIRAYLHRIETEDCTDDEVAA